MRRCAPHLGVEHFVPLHHEEVREGLEQIGDVSSEGVLVGASSGANEQQTGLDAELEDVLQGLKAPNDWLLLLGLRAQVSQMLHAADQSPGQGNNINNSSYINLRWI